MYLLCPAQIKADFGVNLGTAALVLTRFCRLGYTCALANKKIDSPVKRPIRRPIAARGWGGNGCGPCFFSQEPPRGRRLAEFKTGRALGFELRP